MTCFAGRQSCMSLLMKYVEDLIANGHIHEFHAWNFAKDPKDEVWLKQRFTEQLFPNKSIIKQTTGYSYVPSGFFLTKHQRSFSVKVKCTSDAYILLKSPLSDEMEYEILLGGWGNRASVIRQGKQGKDLNHLLYPVFKPNNEYVNVLITFTDKNIEVFLQDSKQTFMAPHNITVSSWNTLFLEVHLASWEDSTATWSFKDSYAFSEEFQFEKYKQYQTSQPDTRLKLFHPADKKQWSEYYGHYTRTRYPEHVIIKCDDDIVFIDPQTFPKYIEKRVKDDTHILMFPSIINNEICAYYQQQRGIIPEHIVNIGYEPLGFGPMWKDGIKTQRLHEFFLNHTSQVLQKSKCTSPRIQDIIVNDRISINFFAIKSKDLHAFQLIGRDDEHDLTQWIPGALGKSHCINLECVVSHLAYFKQKETGLDANKLIEEYSKLYEERKTTTPENIIHNLVSNIIDNIIANDELELTS